MFEENRFVSSFFNQEGTDGFIELEGRECLKEGNTYPNAKSNLFLETSAEKEKKQ